MERRDFVKALATAAIATQAIPDMAEALTAQIEGLRAATGKKYLELIHRIDRDTSVSYTHLTLPTNREV